MKLASIHYRGRDLVATEIAPGELVAVASLPGRESAATAGFGFAVQGRRVSSVVELAKPLTHPDVEGRKDLALFAELSLSF